MASTPTRLWGAAKSTEGQRLDLKSAAYSSAVLKGQKPVGRTAYFDASSIASLKDLQQGSAVVIPLPGGEEASGVVNLVQVDPTGAVHVGGRLTGSQTGSFSIGTADGKTGGRILLTQEQLAYTIAPTKSGQFAMREIPMSDIICFPLPREPVTPGVTPVAAAISQQSIPVLSSRPTSASVLYLNFAGATVTDPDWNSGTTIVAAPANVTSAQITEIWSRVKEDYWPFDIDVTTDPTRYSSTAPGHRMRVIITPTDTAAPGSGGVAYLGTFTLTAPVFSWLAFNSDNPCWVFNSGVTGIAEAVSHELGHTLGLSHDTDNRYDPTTQASQFQYYLGHGDSVTGWAPIMGASYYKPITQWSKGEYPYDTNHEDDVAIISGTIPMDNFYGEGTGVSNSTGYIADDAGNTRAAAAVADFSTGSWNTSGIVSSAADVDFYSITLLTANTVTISANPANTYPSQPDLDIQLELQDSSGNVLASSNPDTSLSASITSAVSAGTYYVKILGVGRTGNPGAGDYGYTNYASIGQYTLNGSLAILPAFPKFAAGRYHSLRIDSQSLLYATGTNTYGQLGTGNTTTTSSATVVTLPGQTVVDIAAGAQHSLILTSAKELWATGNNDNGELGDGTIVAKSTPIKIATSVAGVAAGLTHSAFLKTDGTLWTVGGNDSGQLGNGTILDSHTPVQVATNVVDLAAGLAQTLFIKSDGTLWGMGDMNGSGVAVSTPIQIASGVRAVSAGAYHSLFIKTDGTLWSLGYNNQGQLDTGNQTTVTTPVQVATGVRAVSAGYFFSAFIKTDNSLWSVGRNNSGQIGDGTLTTPRLTAFQVATNVAAVSAGENYMLFSKNDGSLWATGYNANGQFGNGGTTTVSAPVQISIGNMVAPGAPSGLAIAANGAVDRLNINWQPMGGATTYNIWRGTTNSFGSATQLAQNVRWAFYQDLTASANTTYYYWVTSTNSAGTSAPSTSSGGILSPPTAPAFTTHPSNQSVGLGGNGTFTVVATGSPVPTYQWQRLPAGSGTWGNLSNTGAYSGATSSSLTIAGATLVMNGDQFRCVITNGSGTATSNAALLTVVGPPAVVVVSSGYRHGMFVKSDGTLWSMGLNDNGQLGDGTTTSRSSPVQVATSVVAVSAGWYHSLFIKSDGTLWGTGSDYKGSLGNGTSGIQYAAPLQIATGVVAAEAGQECSFFIKSDGTMWAMGDNSYQQLGDGTSTMRTSPVLIDSDVISVSAGQEFTLYLKADGTLWAVGIYGPYGQIGNGTGSGVGQPVMIASGVKSIAAGAQHSIIIKTDESAWTFGRNDSGQLGDSTQVQRNSPVQIATGIQSADAGGDRTFFIKTDGSLWGFGSNYIGAGSSSGTLSPTSVTTTVGQVSTGLSQSYLIKTDGSLWGFGYNFFGELGDGTTTDRLSPVQITPATVFAVPVGVTGVSATQGLSIGVRLTWSAPIGSPQYEVWRNSTNDSSTATKLAGAVPIPLYYDLTASSGVTYYYWIKAANSTGASGFGSVTSGSKAPASVAPVFTTQPLTQSVRVGGTASFTVVASGYPAPTFQWKKNGTPIGGATSSTLTLNNVQMTDAATYTVVATNSVTSVTSNPAVLTIKGAAAHDLDGDGKADFLYQNTVTGDRSIRLMNGPTEALNVPFNISADWTIAGLGDFNGDGQNDILWQNKVTGDISIWLMNGIYPTSAFYLGTIPVEWKIAAIADFNGDGKPDLLWENTTTGDRQFWLMNGLYPSVGVGLGNIPVDYDIAGVGDFNGDGQPDIVWQNKTTGDRLVWLMNGTTPVLGVGLGNIPVDWNIAAIGDYNGDGKPDIIWENTVTGDRLLWLMDGETPTLGVSLGQISPDWKIRN